MKKERKDKYNNGFLISCVSCIVMLLAVCYFGINATSMKGTAAATTTYSCSNGLNKVSSTSGEYCCPTNYDKVVPSNGVMYCVLSGYEFIGTETGGSDCYYESDTELSAPWKCTLQGAIDGSDYYSCLASNYSCVTEAIAASSSTEYTITYDGNGGTVKGNATYPLNTAASSITLLGDTDVVRTNYTLLGWSTNKNATTATYSKGASYSVTADVTLYAIWAQNEYTITYNGNGGTVKGNATFALTTAPGNITLLGDTDTTWTNHTLLGWSTSSAATAATYNKGATYNVTGNATLYAVWKINQYVVTLDANSGLVNGVGVYSFPAVNAGSSVTLVSATKSGYTFNGWYSSRTGGTKIGTTGSYTPTGNVTLYAHWTENTTSIAKPSNSLCKSGLKYTGSNQVITTATSGVGYTLSGYSQKDAGSYSVTATLSSGYKWSDGSTGTVSFNCSIGKATPVLTLSKYSMTIIEGQTDTFTEQSNAAGNFANSSQKTNIATVTPATYPNVTANNIKTVTVTGLVAGTSNITVVLTPNDTKNYTSATKTVAVTVVTASTEEEEETSSTFTATFNPNGGKLEGNPNLSCNTTSNSCVVTGLPKASKSGYNFRGWGESSSCAVGNSDKLTLNGNKTYYACWEKIAETPKDEEIKNPQTSDFAIAIVAVLGVASVAYLVYYYKKFEKGL